MPPCVISSLLTQFCIKECCNLSYQLPVYELDGEGLTYSHNQYVKNERVSPKSLKSLMYMSKHMVCILSLTGVFTMCQQTPI